MQVFEKKIFGSGMTALKISIEEMEDMKTLKSLEEVGLMRKDVNEAIKNESKYQKGGFLGMLLGTLLLAASMLRNMLTGKHEIPGGGVISY